MNPELTGWQMVGQWVMLITALGLIVYSATMWPGSQFVVYAAWVLGMGKEASRNWYLYRREERKENMERAIERKRERMAHVDRLV